MMHEDQKGSNDKTNERRVGQPKSRLHRLLVIAVTVLVAGLVFIGTMAFLGVSMTSDSKDIKYNQPAVVVNNAADMSEPLASETEFADDGAVAADEIQEELGVVPVERQGDYTFSKMTLDFTYSEARKCTLVIVNGKVLEDTISGHIPSLYGNEEVIGTLAGSLDESKYLILDVDGGVYLVSADGLVKVANDGNDIELSPDGSKGVYAGESGMYLFTTFGGIEPVKISDDKVFSQADFSPDGNTLVYNAVYSSSSPAPDYSSGRNYEESYKLKIYKDGVLSILAEDAHAFSTSNNGEFVYYRKQSDGTLHLANAITGETRMVAERIGTAPFTNETGEEMVYTTIEGVFYTEKGNDAHKISDNPYGLVGGEFQKIYDHAYMVTPDGAVQYESKAMGSKTLKGKVYEIGGEIVYLDDNVVATQIATRSANSYMSVDGKTLYYIEDEFLYRMGIGIDADPKRLVCGVRNFEVSDDQQHIYYIDLEDNLNYLAPSGETILLGGDVGDIEMLANNRLYFIGDYQLFSETPYEPNPYNNLYYSQNGESAVLVKEDVSILEPNEGKTLKYDFTGGYDDFRYLIYYNYDKPIRFG